MSVKVKELDNLLLTEQVAQTLSKKSKGASDKVLSTIRRLNEFGASHAFLGRKKLKNLKNGWWELRINYGNNEWRILFRKISKNPTKYGLVYMFPKDTDAILTKDWKKARNLARSEDWM